MRAEKRRDSVQPRVGWVPALSPGPSPGYLVLAAAPTTLLAAQQLRDGQRRSIRLVRGCSQAHVGAKTVADAQRYRNSAEESAGLAASLHMSCSLSSADGRGSAGWDGAARGGANKKATRPRPCRHSAESAAATASGGPQRRGAPPRRGGAGTGGGSQCRPAKNNLWGPTVLPPRSSILWSLVGLVCRDVSLQCGWKVQPELSGFSERQMCTPVPASAAESLPSIHPFRSSYLPKGNQPLG